MIKGVACLALSIKVGVVDLRHGIHLVHMRTLLGPNTELNLTHLESSKRYQVYLVLCMNTKGIAYVVDSNDWHRMTEAKEFRHDILSEDELKGVPVAITLNKRDLKNCMRKEEMEKG
uniref:Uncharacterized protein n=1 Tax=Magallana gigas TaxID=29159 RepID=A0A8W8MB86_MAGGI